MKAEHETAILVFDYGAAVSFGAVAALAASYVVPTSLPGPLAMVAGMIVGTVSAVPLLGLFSVLLGGFEIVVMSTLIGMSAGMIGAMTAGSGTAANVMGGNESLSALGIGSLVGFCVHTLLRISDRHLRGEVPLDE